MKLFGRGTRNMRLLECLSLLGISTVVLGCDVVFGLQEMRDIRPQPCGWDLQVGPDSNQVITSVANGGNDRVVFAGIFADNVDFGVEPAQETGPGAFVGEVNSDGQLTWTQPIRPLTNLQLPRLAALSNGSTILAGASSSQVDCGGIELLNSTGNTQIYMCGFNNAGMPGNMISHMCSGTGQQTLGGIAKTENSQSFVLVGGYTGKMTCGEAANTIEEISGSTDIFVYKLREVGSVEWARSFGGMGHQLARTVAVDGAGDVLVAGQYTDSFAFPDGGAILEYDPSNSGNDHDIFVAKLSSGGKHQWSKRFGAQANDRVTGIAVNPNGDVFIVGTTGGTIRSVTTAGTIIEHSATENEFDYFLLKLNGEDGTGQWIRGFPSPGGTDPNMSVAANSTEVVVSGTFNGSLVLDEETSVELKGKSVRDSFIAAFSPDNRILWHKHWATKSESEAVSALTAHPSGLITWGGAFAQPIDFGCGMRTSRSTDGILVNILP